MDDSSIEPWSDAFLTSVCGEDFERAAEHPDMTDDLAEVLSTASVTVEHRTITGVKID